ncbi:hypothetical protein GP486_007305 [Trichoglossum hirsutum]|uniref:Uncharacterized protein n=1 Tax=Trichoglossum hirsutum TaxID=265104 RepID=A0A9P8IC06_9PEZI|nr:hypothetical protein GP486_007305 [Trichoglossum hirsutum]
MKGAVCSANTQFIRSTILPPTGEPTASTGVTSKKRMPLRTRGPYRAAESELTRVRHRSEEDFFIYEKEGSRRLVYSDEAGPTILTGEAEHIVDNGVIRIRSQKGKPHLHLLRGIAEARNQSESVRKQISSLDDIHQRFAWLPAFRDSVLADIVSPALIRQNTL